VLGQRVFRVKHACRVFPDSRSRGLESGAKRNFQIFDPLNFLADDPHEFNNLARNPEYAQIIEHLSRHLTFRYPEIPQDGWIGFGAVEKMADDAMELWPECRRVD